jgi:hypothetical protein
MREENDKNVISEKNKEIQKLRDEISKRSREIHLQYTYKKRFNDRKQQYGRVELPESSDQRESRSHDW